jgi:hypothetical protein
MKKKRKILTVLTLAISAALVLVVVLVWRAGVNKTEILYDLDGNGAVGMSDVLNLSSKSGTNCNTCPEDLNEDGKIDQADLDTLQKYIQ